MEKTILIQILDTAATWLNVTVATWLTAILTGVLAYAAWKQLNQLNDSIKTNSLMAVLELEAEMSGKKEKHDTLVADIPMLEEYQNNKSNTDLDPVLNKKRKLLSSSLEDYLYSLNRLCYCIKFGHIKDKDWRSEYRDIIFQVVDNNKSLFDVSSKYPRILDLYNEWRRE